VTTERMEFREDLLLEGDKRLGDVMDPWQREDFEALDDPAHRHGYLERPRGHDKTGAAGTEVVVESFLGGPEQVLLCFAVDEDQAGILFGDVVGKIRRRPDLNAKVIIGKREITVKATRTVLRVMSSDAPSAYGLRPLRSRAGCHVALLSHHRVGARGPSRKLRRLGECRHPHPAST